MIEKSKMTGFALATAAAAMFLAGCQSGGASSGTMKSSDASTANMKCFGSNACKGQGACKTAMNECKGQNSCKGHGFVMTTEKACSEHFGRA